MKERQRLWNISIKSGSKAFRNNLRRVLDKAKREYSNNQLDIDDPKKSWSVLRNLSGLEPKKSDRIFLRDGDKLEDRPEKVAQIMNKYFVDKVENIVRDHPPDPVLASAYTERYLKAKKIGFMEFKPVEKGVIRKIIGQLSSTRAVGTDGISVILIKMVVDILAPFITYIINLSIVTSTYPDLGSGRCGKNPHFFFFFF